MDELDDYVDDLVADARDGWNPDDLPPSQQRLLDDLRDADAPDAMIRRCLNGNYHDYASRFTAPKHVLVRDCLDAGLSGVAQHVRAGRYDP